MVPNRNKSQYLLIVISIIFVAFFLFKAVINMVYIPFHDYDEAHRAEKAKRMKEYHSYFVPMTGSEFDRLINVSVPFKDNPDLRIYYHVERPFFEYLLMVISISYLGEREFAFRLPSFIFGLLTIGFLLLAIRKLSPRIDGFALAVAFLSVVTSADLWLSSEYAQLDTALTFFTFSSLILILIFMEFKKMKWLILSAISFALGALSKGQPEALFSLYIPFLFLRRKLSLRNVLLFAGIFLLITVPWIVYISFRFGFWPSVNAILGFAFSSSTAPYYALDAPFIWYVRWWWESLRPGWTLFLSLFFLDVMRNKLDFRKQVLSFYIFSSLFLFSLSSNKIWWYVLPLVPVMGFYLYFSVSEYLKKNKASIVNISLVIILASLPIFLKTTTKVSLLYGIGELVLSFFILKSSNLFTSKKILPYAFWVFLLAFTCSLGIFTVRFPNIEPLSLSIKPVSLAYAHLPGRKCLWLLDISSESVLYYSSAGEVTPLNPDSQKSLRFDNCKNYLMTTASVHDPRLENYTVGKLITKNTNLSLFEIDKNKEGK